MTGTMLISAKCLKMLCDKKVGCKCPKQLTKLWLRRAMTDLKTPPERSSTTKRTAGFCIRTGKLTVDRPSVFMVVYKKITLFIGKTTSLPPNNQFEKFWTEFRCENFFCCQFWLRAAGFCSYWKLNLFTVYVFCCALLVQ